MGSLIYGSQNKLLEGLQEGLGETSSQLSLTVRKPGGALVNSSESWFAWGPNSGTEGPQHRSCPAACF